MLGCELLHPAAHCFLIRVSLVAKHRRRVHDRLTSVNYYVGNSLGCKTQHSGPTKNVYLRSHDIAFVRPMGGRRVCVRTPACVRKVREF